MCDFGFCTFCFLIFFWIAPFKPNNKNLKKKSQITNNDTLENNDNNTSENSDIGSKIAIINLCLYEYFPWNYD